MYLSAACHWLNKLRSDSDLYKHNKLYGYARGEVLDM